MFLEVVLDVLAVDDALGSKGAPGEEEGVDGLGEKAAVVGRPDHSGEGCGIRVMGERVFTVDDGGLGGSEIAGIDTARGKGPERGARAAREAGPLVRGLHVSRKNLKSGIREDGGDVGTLRLERG